MLSKVIQFVKEHLDDIILVIGVILISLLSFAMGYIAAKQQEKEPLKIESKKIPSSPPSLSRSESSVVDEDSFTFTFDLRKLGV